MIACPFPSFSLFGSCPFLVCLFSPASILPRSLSRLPTFFLRFYRVRLSGDGSQSLNFTDDNAGAQRESDFPKFTQHVREELGPEPKILGLGLLPRC